MHFHLLKPLRGWRELGGEVGIIDSGNFMYEARWPYSAVCRASDIFVSDGDGKDFLVVFGPK